MSTSKIKQSGILGIDAGGTFTDLAFLDGENYKVLAKAKTPTLHNDLIKTVENGLDMILELVEPSSICSFNLATTLATNAIVEDRLYPAALLLIGYEKEIEISAASNGTFDTPYIISISGGHDNRGNELAPLDEKELRIKISELPKSIKSIAISGFFSVRNALHELKAAEIIRELRPEIYISYGHDLSTDLNAIKRATTALLNAGLIPVIMELLDSVEKVCLKNNINVPITVVRGDGSIVGAEWAKLHPVEMILSGPAASACGGCFLAKNKNSDRRSWVVDIGGTTTDIINLDNNGKPATLKEGATVAGHKTLIQAIDIYTFGLGGDSRVIFDKNYNLVLTNRRVRPLCSLASEYPAVLDELRELKKMHYIGEPLFIMQGEGRPSNEIESSILKKLSDGPVSLSGLLKRVRLLKKHHKQIDVMEQKGLITYSSFTPTDALHVLGRFEKWNIEAAVLGAELMTDGMHNNSCEETALQVQDIAIKKISMALFKKSMSNEGIDIDFNGEGEQIIKYALNKEKNDQIKLYLNANIIGAGAPSWAFIPSTGSLLHEDAVLPENTDVAGAVGAAVGSFSMTYPVRIMISKDHKSFRLYYPPGTADFDNIDRAVTFASDFMEPWLIRRAEAAGAKKPEVSYTRHDAPAYIGGYSNRIPLWSELVFTVSAEN